MSCDTIKTESLDAFIGQKNIVETLKVSIAASKIRNEPFGHILIKGPGRCGKSTLVNAIINEIDTSVHRISFRVITADADLAAALTNVNDGDILLIEDIGAMQQNLLDLLGMAMEEFSLEMILGKGQHARSICLDLPHFTLIGVMDEKQVLPKKLLNCFYLKLTFVDYLPEELVLLAKKWCDFHCVNISDEAAKMLASYAKGSNRRLVNSLKRARDFATVINDGVISADVADKTINNLRNNELI